MNKTTKILLLALAVFFLVIGIKSAMHSKTYAELTNIQTINGTIFKLHCPTKGAAALSLADSDITYNLTTKFKGDYCNDTKSQVLLGKNVTIESVQVSGDYYQVYQLKEKDWVIISPDDVESDQSGATIGLFLLAFLLIALVLYKSRTVTNKTN
jgi:hypothetical protein